ncbi:MAG: tetratricopeptide repeat protein [Bacteroidales bacterium]
MKKLLLISVFFCGCTVFTPLQRSKFLTVTNFIDTEKYSEAKEVIEEMITEPESSQWARTWFLRGHLCQEAYKKGISENDKSLTKLYKNQLYVAYNSFEKARSIDRGGKLERQLAPKYVVLANSFKDMGEKHFNNKRYNDALRAFEYALKVSQSSMLEIELDKNLVYNAALAAYEDEDWDAAIKHLKKLHEESYSTNATHLLFNANLENEDTLAARNVMLEGIEMYDDNDEMVLLLTDLLFITGETDSAIEILNQEINKNPSNYRFYYTKGLVYQKLFEYDKAIESYTAAIEHAPEEPMIYFNLATCYYNIGVDIEEKTRTLTNNRQVLELRAESAEAFDTAISWLDKASEKAAGNKDVLTKVYDLYRALRVTEKAEKIEEQM